MSSPPPNTSPPGSGFTPRKEFIRELPSARSSFALLAIAGANCIRLYSFAPKAIQALRTVLEQDTPIISFREDAAQNLCEFALERKAWANPKSVKSEKLLVDIIAVIYHCGYTYLSTIDYGREADDRLAMAFSRPDGFTPASRSVTPLPASPLIPRLDNTSSLGGERPKPKRTPFAISFSSVTVMRVISPPLHLTPAILQAVRGSWPRGVVSEKSVGGNSYEFKLKGYGWFQQDTFATDSLQHILTLLSSLDSHCFSLLTSISLTNRSRVKDLWIFTGPVAEDEASLDSLLEMSPFKRSIPPSSSEVHLTHSVQQHRRIATDPSPSIPHSPIIAQHSRSATDSPHRPQLVSPPHVLRKAAPRAQVPVSVIQDSDIADVEHPVLRAQLPSIISSAAENMTGIGSGQSPNVFYTTSPFQADHTNGSPPIPLPVSTTPGRGSPVIMGQSTARAASERTETPPLVASPSPHRSTPSPTGSKPSTPANETSTDAPPLLGIGTFRDSAFSSNSEISCDIPIKWTGPLQNELKAEQDLSRLKASRLSSTPMFPGGWQPTPIQEKAEDDMNMQVEEKITTPIHEIDSRVQGPEIVMPDVSDMALRKSEAALVGIIQSTSTGSPSPPPQQTPRKESVASPGGQGWVLVNVENSNSALSPPPVPEAVNGEADKPLLEDPLVGSPLSKTTSTPPATLSPIPEQASSAAKAIVIIDALESKQKKSRSGTPKDGEGGSAVRRFFSLNKKNSKKDLSEEQQKPKQQVDGEKISPSSIPRSNLRDRLRRIGTPEAPRNEGKRRSID